MRAVHCAIHARRFITDSRRASAVYENSFRTARALKIPAVRTVAISKIALPMNRFSVAENIWTSG